MVEKKKKIVFHLNCLEQGGAERVVTTLANQFVNKYDVIIATMWFAENEYQIDERIRHINVGLNDQQSKKGRLLNIYHRNANLRKFLKKEKPDIVIAFAKKANYRALIATLGTGIPVIVSVRANPYGYYSSLLDRILVTLLYPTAAGNVFQTKGAQNFFSRKIRSKSRIILNPINEKYINVEGSIERRKEIVTTGRITELKNHQMLIEAFFEVYKKHPEYVLKIYGTDSKDGTWECLKKLIEQHQATKYVFLMGGCDCLEKVLPSASIFAFTSNNEGLPNSLMEAMAMGLPVIATDCPCGGPATIVEHGKSGLLISVKDKEALIDGLNQLIENPDFAENLGQNAKGIVEIANAKEICKQWEAYIEEILN